MVLRKQQNSKKIYTTEFLRHHLDRLRKESLSRDLSMAAILEMAIQQYCYSPETTHTPFSKSEVEEQREKRKKIGIKRHSMHLRPTEIMSINNLANLQRRPPKHVVEDALTLFFGQSNLSNYTPQTESAISKSKQVKGIFSEVKSRIQTTPRKK